MTRLWLTVLALALPMAAQADEWATYTNARFGTTISYPADLFQMLPPPDNDDGRSFVSTDGAARFIVYAGYNVLEQTLTELADAAAAEADSVIYRQESGRWFLLQGLRGGDIFYEKVVLTDEGVIHSFEISYPATRRQTFDPIAADMVDAMSSGR